MEQLVAQYRALQKTMIGQVEDYLIIKFREIFNKNPELKTFKIRCYTPYFNDGDECEFIYYIVNEDDMSRKTYNGIYSILKSVPTEILEFALNGDSELTITPGKIEKKEYTDHE
jgi:hypothetical protein